MKPGDSVHYIPFEGCEKLDMENGIVKSLCDDPDYIFVVYHWSDEPGNYMNYTAARTHVGQLKEGWV